MSVALCSPISTSNPLIPEAQQRLSVAAPAGACLNILIKGFCVVHSPGSCAGREGGVGLAGAEPDAYPLS